MIFTLVLALRAGGSEDDAGNGVMKTGSWSCESSKIYKSAHHAAAYSG